MNKKILVGGAALALLALEPSLASSQLVQSGAAVKGEVTGVLQGFTWVFAFLPFALGFFLALNAYNKLVEKEEQQGGQGEPKAMKFAKVFAFFVAGILISYSLYGVFGMVFMNKGFNESWGVLVVDFWAGVF